jgi:hypothetical protein
MKILLLEKTAKWAGLQRSLAPLGELIALIAKPSMACVATCLISMLSALNDP